MLTFDTWIIDLVSSGIITVFIRRFSSNIGDYPNTVTIHRSTHVPKSHPKNQSEVPLLPVVTL